jgi:hypothetical protein
MRPKCTKVRACSESEGSGTEGWSRAAPVPACFLIDVEDITIRSCRVSNRIGGCTQHPRSRLRAIQPNPGGKLRGSTPRAKSQFFRAYLNSTTECQSNEKNASKRQRLVCDEASVGFALF